MNTSPNLKASNSSEKGSASMTKHNKSDRTKADEEFLKTYDILQLQNALGHKHIKSTWDYIARKNMLIRPFEEAKA